jgi:2-iminoacetate synthase
MCAYRLFLPSADITISTRERAEFRDGVLGLVATKASAGVSTAVGEHAVELADDPTGDEQFEIADERDVAQMCAAIRARGLQPVMTDHVRLEA